jgi:CubicO group peptidase (beta-lactamase class C family)
MYQSLNILVLTTIIFGYSCSQSDKKSDTKLLNINIDSTAYYDSIYASLKFSIDTFFRNKYLKDEFNGNILFSENNRIIISGSYGYAAPDKNDTLTLKHAFQLASVSKTITATAVLMLLEKKLIELDQKVNHYLDSFPYPGVTVRMLLCHRSGLSNYMYYCDKVITDKNKPIYNKDVYEITCKHKPPPYYQPNQTYDYCNTNYVLLALIIEKVSGMSYSDFLQKNIFIPLKMEHTFVYEKGKTKLPQFAVAGYDHRGKMIADYYQNGVTGDKGIYSTVEDLYKFDLALRQQKLLTDSTLQLAYKATSNEHETQGNDNYGLGWRIKQSHAGYKVVYHTGWWKGFRSYFIRNITKNQTIIVLDNIKRGPFLSVEELLQLLNSN